MADKTIAAATQRPVVSTGDPTGGAAEAILRQYWPQLRRLLPPHINAESWYSSVFAALYKGRNPGKSIDLARAANANPESLMFALFDAARLGLEPGTPHYYLTPRPNRNAQGGVEVLGIVGYQGEIELIYNAGAVTSVTVNVVRSGGTNPDFYRYRRGVDRVPTHQYDPWMRKQERGDLVGVYAYGIMRDGSVSHVVELNVDDIDRAKRASSSAGKTSHFWDDKDDVETMWMKTGIHRLKKFVPTSATIRHFTATADGTPHRAVAASRPRPELTDAARTAIPGVPVPPAVAIDEGTPLPPLDITQFAQPPAPEDAITDITAITRDIEPDFEVSPASPPTGGAATAAMHRAIMRLIGRHVTIDAHRHNVFTTILGRPVASGKELTISDASHILDRLNAWNAAGEMGARLAEMRQDANSGADDDTVDIARLMSAVTGAVPSDWTPEQIKQDFAVLAGVPADRADVESMNAYLAARKEITAETAQ